MRLPTYVIAFLCLSTRISSAQCDSLPLVFFPSEVFLCAGNTLSIDPGIDAVSYEWSTGDTTQTITVIEEGTYCLTITDSLGCMSSGCLDVIIPPAPIIEFSTDPWVCGPYTIDMFVLGDFFTDYQWSTGDTTEWLRVQEEGEYCVTVTDQYGCKGSDCFTFEQIIVEPEILGDLEFCVGEETVLYTNESYAEYIWSNGVSGPSIITNVPGVYCLTVTDINGCTGSTCVSIVVIPPVVMHLDSFVCEGIFLPIRNNHSVHLTPVAGEMHDVRQNDCDTIIEYIITHYPIFVAYEISGDFTVGQGVIDLVEVVGATGPYEYAWNTGSINPRISGLFPGLYTVTITDSAGCNVSETFDIPNVPRPDIVSGEPPVIAVPDPLNSGGSEVSKSIDLLNPPKPDTRPNSPISAFPNPFTSEITVLSELQAGNQGILEIYNYMGEEVVQSSVTDDGRIHFTISGPPGIYVIRLIESNGSLYSLPLFKVN